MTFLLISVGSLALITVIWRRQSRLARMTAAGLALALYGSTTPSPYRALRHATNLPESARVSQNLWTSAPATPFESGLFTMYEAVQRDFAAGARYQLLALGMLTVLAMLPRRSHSHGDTSLSAARATPAPTSPPAA